MVAVEAHWRRTGMLPRLLHSLGTGESFEIAPEVDGFADLASGAQARRMEGGLVVTPGEHRLALVLEDDVGFSGHAAGERFTGRAGGGSTVTIYAGSGEYFQYAVALTL